MNDIDELISIECDFCGSPRYQDDADWDCDRYIPLYEDCKCDESVEHNKAIYKRLNGSNANE